MCSVLYVASDQELDLIPRDDGRPAFHVTGLRDGESTVRRNFSKRLVYFVGASLCCSCAFVDWKFDLEDDAEAAESHRAEVQPLMSYVENAVGRSKQVELYICQDGKWDIAPRRRQHLQTDEWKREAFRLEEGVLYTITDDQRR